MGNTKICNGDFIAGIVCVIVGLGFYMNVHAQEMMQYDLLGSKFFPKIACAGIILFGGILILQSILQMAELKHENCIRYVQGASFFNKKKLIFIAYTIIYFSVLELSIGFAYATPIYMFLNMLLLEQERPSAIKLGKFAVFCVSITLATYLFFNRVLYLLLP